MADNQNNPKQECKCDKAFKKQVAEIYKEIAQLRKEVATLRKAVRK